MSTKASKEAPGKLILTSQGFYGNRVTPFLKSTLCGRGKERAVIVTTAADNRENNKFNIEDRKILQGLGFEEVDFVDLEKSEPSHFCNCNLIYVCGGNTFRLIKAARQFDFKKNY